MNACTWMRLLVAFFGGWVALSQPGKINAQALPPDLGSGGVRARPPRDGDAVDAPVRVRLDIEIDPLAYLFEGYSVHVGLRVPYLRLDLGAFGASYPTFLKPNRQLDAREHGAGVKLDLRMPDPPATAHWSKRLIGGPFVGLGASYSWLTVREPVSGQAGVRLRFKVAVRLGWEVPIAAAFYVTPWVSVGYTPGAKAVVVSEQRWANDPVSVFATLHLGWRAP